MKIFVELYFQLYQDMQRLPLVYKHIIETSGFCTSPISYSVVKFFNVFLLLMCRYQFFCQHRISILTFY